MNKINFMLPGLYEHFKLNCLIVKFLKKYPEKFYDNINIGCFYGNFQYCIWDGGRIFSNYTPTSYEEINDIKNFLLEENIPLRLIFTNPILEEKHLLNHFCNLVATICEHENNEIVVNSPLLEDYLRKNYPKYSFISSTTKCNSIKDSLKEINDYKYVCLDYNQNKNFKILENLSKKEKDKIEFLINAICPPGCPNRKEHYRLNGISHLNLGKKYDIKCQIKNNTISNCTFNYKNNLTPEEIYNNYYNMGYCNFKIEGRTLSDIEVLLNYARYLFKPEHQYELINLILMEL